jgi:hypothetical protein
MILRNIATRLANDPRGAGGAPKTHQSETDSGRPIKQRHRFSLLILLSMTLLLLGLGLRGAKAHAGSARSAQDESRREARADTTLLVWAGDKAHIAPDFLAVIDFYEDSPNYGKVLRTVPLTGPGAVGNEPHHVGLSADGKTVALGGLLSVLRGQDQMATFRTCAPTMPS